MILNEICAKLIQRGRIKTRADFTTRFLARSRAYLYVVPDGSIPTLHVLLAELLDAKQFDLAQVVAEHLEKRKAALPL